MKERLLILISSSIAGGAQIYIYNLINKIKGLYSILVICPTGFLADKLRQIDEVEIRTMNIDITRVIKLHLLLKEEIKKHRRIIINCHLLGTSFWTYLALKRIHSFRYVVTLHNKLLYDRISILKKIIFPRVLKLLSKDAVTFISVSNEISLEVERYAKKTCVYIPPSVPPPLKKKNVEMFRGANGKLKIGYIGRLSPEKNPKCFLMMAKIVKEKLPNSQFYFVGDGELRNNLEEYVRTNNMTNYVNFTGFINDTYSIMLDLDVLVISSNTEGTPLVLLEAMSIGLPVVSTSVGNIPSIINNKINGLIVKKESPDALADSVFEISNDIELYKRISIEAIQTMQKNHDFNQNIKNYRKVIDWGEEL